ncbi:MAG: hypothetical protein Q4A61_02855 [Porphyromonadaceae bacterium]|nr:hypothetical protein [Porphyromonadaceae bacterium]
MNYRLLKLIGACLLGINLVACQDKFDNLEPSPKAEAEPTAEGERAGVPIGDQHIPLFETEFHLSDDELRYIGANFEDQPSGDRSTLLSPRLLFAHDDYVWENGGWRLKRVPIPNINADVLFRREKAGQVDFLRERGVAEFISVSNDERSAKVRVWIVKPNAKENKSLFTFESDETWHAMLILNAETGGTTFGNKDVATFGESPADRAALTTTGSVSEEQLVKYIGNNQSGGMAGKVSHRIVGSVAWRYSAGNLEIPLVSDWKKLKIKTGATHTDNPKIPNRSDVLVRLAEEVRFNIKPQGVLLNYQISANVFEGVDMRRAGVISNTLDFQGRYKLDKESLEQAFASRRGDGFGIPKWEGTKSALMTEGNLTGLAMWKPAPEDLELGFPWDMPSISDRFSHMTGVSDTGTGKVRMLDIEREADIAMTLFPGAAPNSRDYPRHAMAVGIGLTTPRVNQTNDDAPGNFPDVVNHVQWAMPKEQTPAQPFTYLWISAHSGHSAEQYYPYHNPRALTAHDTPKEYVDFLKQKDVRHQPMVVVHQTNTNFKDQVGLTPRLYAMITTDLMITEVVYNYKDGKNYSVVELQNPSKLPIDLRDYALASVDVGSNRFNAPTFLNPDGSVTSNLDEAELFYLDDLSISHMINGYGAKDGLTRAHHMGHENEQIDEDLYNKTFTGDYKHPYHAFGVDGKYRLEAGQTVLLGAPDFIAGSSGDVTTKSWWSGFFPEAQQRKWYADEHRLRYFVGCNHKVLHSIGQKNSEGVRNGLALIKIINGKKKVIDATAPIRPFVDGNTAFAGADEGRYRQEMSKTNSLDYYVLKRKDGVVFPYVAPYRTSRATADWSDDWELLTAPNSHKLGHRWLASIDGSGLTTKHVLLHRFSYFVPKRTPMGNPGAYKSSRPIHR